MTTEQALLAAIWESPHDDLPRLVYADWLDETGDPAKAARAEFIRVQCELAKMDVEANRRDRLERKERDLWHRHRRVFKQGLPPRLSDKPFHRGFVSPPLLEVTGYQLEHQYWPILSSAPLWRVAVHNITEGNMSSLINDSLFLRLTELRVSATGHAFRTLVASPRRYNLTELSWAYSFARVQGVQWLTECDMPHLHTLRFPSADLGDEGASVLAGSELARRLTRLDLSSNNIGTAGISAMRADERFPMLADLDLSYTKNGDEVVAELTGSGPWPSLRRLRMFGSELTARSAELLAEWQGAVTLEHVDLSGNVEVGRAGVVALTTSPHLSSLRSIRLSPADRDYSYVVDVLRERFGIEGVTSKSNEFYVQGALPAAK